MALIRILAIGTKMPNWIQQGSEEYTKRMPVDCSVEFIEIPAEKRGKQLVVDQALQKESTKLISAIKPNNFVIALDVKGKAQSTESIADSMKSWQQVGKHIDFLIGGPEGLHQDCLNKADVKWSLSELTLPHPLVRVVLAEQLYRAWSILQNHPYHR